MSTFGLIGLLLSFAATVICVIALVAGRALGQRELGSTLSWAGRIAALLSALGLSVACLVMVYCLFAGDVSIQYVLDNRSFSSGVLGALYKLSGLWAGRSGSLMFWAWLVSVFGALVALHRLGKVKALDNMAVLVMQLVLAAFLGVLLFSPENMPFALTDASYFNEDGSLTAAAQVHGMNSLLQHWAMAIHPPMLFLGYAGLTVPFAYAIAACICNEPSEQWVLRSKRYALAAWFFLTAGIGLGAVWAYVVLGWGGYWGWDPVENASLLPWLMCVALVHSFTLYEKRGIFRCWAVLCASLAFCFCIVGTFISRSGLIESVHAFSGDPTSLALFAALIVLSAGAGAVGCIARRKSFAPAQSAREIESLISRDGAYFVNNVLMVVLTVVLCYLTVAQALPSWLPFGGQSIASGSYELLARPIGALFLLMLAACPLLGWCKTDPRAFACKARVPAVCALLLFVLLAVYWALVLLPAYNSTVQAGDSVAQLVLEQGPAAYYNGLALFSFAVASLLIFTSLFQVLPPLRQLRRPAAGEGQGENQPEEAPHAPSSSAPRRRVSLERVGSAVTHMALGVMLIGMVGSSMYVTERSGYLPYDQATGTCTERFAVGDFELEFAGGNAQMSSDYTSVEYQIEMGVYKDGNYLGRVNPQIVIVAATQQQKYNAGVIGLPQEDLFVVYQGVSSADSSIHIDVRINRLISVVWLGLLLLCAGMLLSTIGARP
ncbi:MAG: heme lyase CcmF/NrfE family subunit, partial [Coriobacteriales bacterium]